MFSELVLLNNDEEQLARVEQAWADCANGFRTGVRLKRDREQLGAQSFLSVHELLEVHRINYQEESDSSALLWALRICLEENLPAPYWCADGILKGLRRVTVEPVSLHDVFGLNKVGLRARGKSALNDRRRLEKATLLYAHVWGLKAKNESISKETALKQARSDLRLGLSQRAARSLFDTKEAEQAKFRKALGLRFGGLRF